MWGCQVVTIVETRESQNYVFFFILKTKNLILPVYHFYIKGKYVCSKSNYFFFMRSKFNYFFYHITDLNDDSQSKPTQSLQPMMIIKGESWDTSSGWNTFSHSSEYKGI